MTIAEEQRLRSAAYEEANLAMAEQRRKAAMESGVYPGGQGYDPDRGNYSTGEGEPTPEPPSKSGHDSAKKVA